jgi:hypothetical protein
MIWPLDVILVTFLWSALIEVGGGGASATGRAGRQGWQGEKW